MLTGRFSEENIREMDGFREKSTKGKTTWEPPFLQSSTQKDQMIDLFLVWFPPCSQYVGTNVPVTRTMDHTEVSRQGEDFQHKQHNYLPRTHTHTHAHTTDMCGPVRQCEAIQSCSTVSACLCERKKDSRYSWRMDFLVRASR